MQHNPRTSWYAVQTRPGQERRAAANLNLSGLETFAPWLRQRSPLRRTHGATMLQPLFPGYIFARFDPIDVLHTVRYTRGVRSVVSYGGVCAPVDDGVIELCRTRLTEDGEVRSSDQFKPGDSVVVLSGPFQDMAGLFDRELSGRERVRILLTAVNYQVRIEIETSNVASNIAAR